MIFVVRTPPQLRFEVGAKPASSLQKRAVSPAAAPGHSGSAGADHARGADDRAPWLG